MYHISLQSLAKEFLVQGLGCCADMLYHPSLHSLANKSMLLRSRTLCRHAVSPEPAKPCPEVHGPIEAWEFVQTQRIT